MSGRHAQLISSNIHPNANLNLETRNNVSCYLSVILSQHISDDELSPEERIFLSPFRPQVTIFQYFEMFNFSSYFI